MKLLMASYADCPLSFRCVRLHKPWRTSKHKGKTQGAILTLRWDRRMWNLWWEA